MRFRLKSENYKTFKSGDLKELSRIGMTICENKKAITNSDGFDL
jgi:hypothetical protein